MCEKQLRNSFDSVDSTHNSSNNSLLSASQPSANPHASSFGITLLSPRLQRAVAASTPSLRSASQAKDSMNSGVAMPKQSLDFDFDSFTIEAVRQRTSSEDDQSPPNSGVRPNGRWSPNAPPYSTSFATVSSQVQSPDRPERSTTNFFQSMRSTELYGSNQRGRLLSTASTAFSDNNGSVLPSRAARSLNDVISSSFLPRSLTAESASQMGLSDSDRMSGWLQRRKGMVIRRWRPQYCLLKPSKDELCFYVNEDTFNGRLEHRFQVLRVTIDEKADDQFIVVGVSREGTPCREVLRATQSIDGEQWFHAFESYLDHLSLESAYRRRPELCPTKDDHRHDRPSSNQSTEETQVKVPLASFSERQRSHPMHRSAQDTTTSSRLNKGSSFADCPMIERKSQQRLAVLEQSASNPSARESESCASTSASPFAWYH